jgi:hypothetical protein
MVKMKNMAMTKQHFTKTTDDVVAIIQVEVMIK